MTARTPVSAPASPDRLLTLDQVAETLQVDRATIYRLSWKDGEGLPIVRPTSGLVRVRQSDLNAYIAAMPNEPVQAPAEPGKRRRGRPRKHPAPETTTTPRPAPRESVPGDGGIS